MPSKGLDLFNFIFDQAQFLKIWDIDRYQFWYFIIIQIQHSKSFPTLFNIQSLKVFHIIFFHVQICQIRQGSHLILKVIQWVRSVIELLERSIC